MAGWLDCEAEEPALSFDVGSLFPFLLETFGVGQGAILAAELMLRRQSGCYRGTVSVGPLDVLWVASACQTSILP